MLNKTKTVFTIGYGNSAPEDFLKRLKDAGVTWIFDLRREGSRAWNGKYSHGVKMEALLAHVAIGYSMEVGLGNHFGSVVEYRDWLKSDDGKEAVEHLSKAFDAGLELETPCLLCAERHPWSAGLPNCHRVHVADALVKLLGEEWTVWHI